VLCLIFCFFILAHCHTTDQCPRQPARANQILAVVRARGIFSLNFPEFFGVTKGCPKVLKENVIVASIFSESLVLRAGFRWTQFQGEQGHDVSLLGRFSSLYWQAGRPVTGLFLTYRLLASRFC